MMFRLLERPPHPASRHAWLPKRHEKNWHGTLGLSHSLRRSVPVTLIQGAHPPVTSLDLRLFARNADELRSRL